MKHLVIGAGATIAEAIALDQPPELWPPVIRNFARKTWADFAPSPMLDFYLQSIGLFEARPDIRELFYELEDAGRTNIEQFMEFVWANRDVTLPNDGQDSPGSIFGMVPSLGEPYSGKFGYWENLLYHGIGRPIADAQMFCFYQDGVGYRNLSVAQAIASRLGKSDLVLNLNYDTIFEVAMTQIGKPFVYAPRPATSNGLIVCKPHGSLNLAANDQGFIFGAPDSIWGLMPPGYLPYSGLVPPRLNKAYAQHPLAAEIIAGTQDRRPAELIFWGIGMTESDTDLVQLYKGWASSAKSIDVINPDRDVGSKIAQVLDRSVHRFSGLNAWLVAHN